MWLVRVKRWQREFATSCESNAPACPAGSSQHEKIGVTHAFPIAFHFAIFDAQE